MRRYFAVVATVSFSLLFLSNAGAVMVDTATGIKRAVAETSAITKVVRVCRHRFFTSRRFCYVDRSRPPTVCHHIRSSSRRDCY